MISGMLFFSVIFMTYLHILNLKLYNMKIGLA